MLRKIRKWSIIILLGNIVVSCAPTNEAAYLQEYTKVEDINTPNNVYVIDKNDNDIIEKGDELYITVLSPNLIALTNKLELVQAVLLKS